MTAPDAADPPADPPGWKRWLLGPDKRLRARVSQQLLAMSLGAGASLVFLAGTLRSGAPREAVIALLAVAALLALLGYAAVRSRWSERLADPSLTSAQIGVSVLLGAFAYPLLGSQRAAVIPLTVLVLAFGMFPLRGRTSLSFALFALFALTLAIAFAYFIWPRGLSAADEITHALTAAVAFLGMAGVAQRLQRIRQRLAGQREQLHRALGRIEAMARRDALTGLYNRGEGDAMLRAALARHRRNGSPLQVAVIDLDHFKRINDEHGHGTGDAVLRDFSARAQACLRTTDAIARWGGEEFLLLLDGAPPEQAREVLQRLLQAVQATPVEHEGRRIGYSFSAGLAQAWPHDSPEKAVDRADQALYRAKREGRARVVADFDTDTGPSAVPA